MKFAVVRTLLLGSFLCLAKGDVRSSPLVDTPLGLIIGRYDISSGKRLYAAFEGVPYAEAPMRELRFKVARPVSPWKDARIANRVGAPCVQFSSIKLMGSSGIEPSEDCLFLNIYTPGTRFKNASRLLPVIFFIPGGAFKSGSGGIYGAQYLLDKDVVLVTINYRLGPLGFLSTEDDTVPGNLGLKDQVVALRWVQDYIEYFAGDPNSVTIVGQSAGGVSVHYHYLTNVTKGLFHRGISISGTALNSWAQTKGSLEKAKKLATILKCDDTDVKEMVECLRTQKTVDIVRATKAFQGWLDNPYVPFGPVVEKGVAKDEFTFIDYSPIEALKSKKVQDLPWITSVVSEDGTFAVSLLTAERKDLEDLNNEWEKKAPFLLDFNYTVPTCLQAPVAKYIREQYLGYEKSDRLTIRTVVKMRNDRLYFYHAEQAARLQAQVTNSSILFYYFSYKGNHSVTEAFTNNQIKFGVSHLDDLGYVLYTFFNATSTPDDQNMQKKMINLWVSFATNGTPEVELDWKRVENNTKTLHYLHIAEPNALHAAKSGNFGNKNFWHSLGFQENHHSMQRIPQNPYWRDVLDSESKEEYVDDTELNEI